MRILRRDDYEIIRDIDAECFPDDARHDGKGDINWLVMSGRMPVGFASLRINTDRQMGFLCRAGVLPNYRRRGIHAKLIKKRVAYAKRIGLCYVATYTLDFIAANNLIRCGFLLYTPDLFDKDNTWLCFRKELT
jgi:GNAT superfamily N-acetyltransferase